MGSEMCIRDSPCRPQFYVHVDLNFTSMSTSILRPCRPQFYVMSTSILRPWRPQLYVHVDLNFTSMSTSILRPCRPHLKVVTPLTHWALKSLYRQFEFAKIGNVDATVKKNRWTDGRTGGRTDGRTDDGRTDDGPTTDEKNSDEKIPTKKFRQKKSDEKIPTKKFRRKKSDENKLGARHGGKARPLRRQGMGN